MYLYKEIFHWDLGQFTVNVPGNDYLQQFIVVKKVKNQHVLNGRTDFLIGIIELLRFLNCYLMF